MKFEWTMPVLAGFRVLGARQWSCLAWAAALGAGFWAMISVAGALMQAMNMPPMLNRDQARWWPVAALAVMGVLCSPLVCAVYRAVLRPEDSRFAYLRIGRTELRVSAILAPFAAALGLISELAMLAHPWNVAVIAAGLLVISPFTLVGPAVFDEGLREAGPAFGMGRRFYWEMVGVNALTWVAFVASSSVINLAWRTFSGASRGDLMALFTARQDPLFLGQWIIALVVAWLLYTAVAVVVVAPAADAYRRLSDSSAPDHDPALGAEAQA